jgi:hypothetical protein
LQVSYDLDAMVTWRAGIEFDGAIYAGVMALPSASMARKVSADVPQPGLESPLGVPHRHLGDASFVDLVAPSGTSGTAPRGARTVVLSRRGVTATRSRPAR